VRWTRTTKFDPRAAALADRHYSRGSPGSDQFMPSGRTIVLLTGRADAVWGTSWQVGDGVLWATHDWPLAWNCSIFRNEGDDLSSDLIREAVAATSALWGAPLEQGFVSFVDASRIRSTNPGYCFLRAGWHRAGQTRSGKIVLQLDPADFPPPELPLHGGAPLLRVPEAPLERKRDLFGGDLRAYRP